MIGTTAAILGAAAIGAVSSALSSHASSSATQKATDAASQAKAADIAAARSMYDSNVTLLDPFRSQGLRAGATLSDLLLGPSSSAAPSTGYAPAPAGSSGSFIDGGGAASSGMYDPAGSSGAIRALSGRTVSGGNDFADTYMAPGMTGVRNVGDGNFGSGSYSMTAPTAAGGYQPVGTVQAQPNGQSAWDTFRNSTNYQFRLGEGERAINQGYAANGTLQSGAALKALTKYGQDYASNELGNYMNLLAGQQNMGLNAARAVAGVGGDLTTQTIGANDSAASATANAALLNGKNQAALYGSLGGTLGKAIGALGASSYTNVNAIPPGFGG